MTLRQLRGFWGIIWILSPLNSGLWETFQPLYNLIAETQQAQTDKLVCSPDT